jgi:hypothetical protein
MRLSEASPKMILAITDRTKDEIQAKDIKSVRFDVDSQQRINESSGSISAKFQYDDDFDNWFPWEC